MAHQPALFNLDYDVESGSPLVNNEFNCHTPEYEAYLKIPSFVKKYIRKSTSLYALASTDFGLKLYENLKKSGKQLRGCNTQPILYAGFETVDIKEVRDFDNPARHLSHVKRCGSPWNCPVCSAKLSTIRSIQLDSLITCGKDNSRFYSMVVLTIQHKAGQDLNHLMSILDDLRKYIQSHRSFREFKEKHKLRFLHVGLELTMSIKQVLKDFHPHNNFVFDFDEKPNLTELELSQFIYNLISIRALKKHGVTLKSPYIEPVKKRIVFKDGINHLIDVNQVKGGVTATYDFKKDYPTKFGLAEEVTLSMYKHGDINGSFHPFQLLDYLRFFELSDETKKLLIEMFREYSLAFRRKSLFRFGRESIKYYKEQYNFEIDVKQDNEEIEESQSTGEVLLEIPIYDWLRFKPTDMQVATLLQLPQEAMKDYIYQRIERKEEEHKQNQIKKGGIVKTFNFKDETVSSMEFEYKPPINDEISNQSIDLNKKREAEIKNLQLLNSSIQSDERDNSNSIHEIGVLII